MTTQLTELTFVLDTSCLIAATDAKDEYHDAMNDLLAAGESGEVRLLVASAFEYDLEKAPTERQEERMQWLAERPFIGRAAGSMTFGVTLWGLPDVLIDDEQKRELENLKEVTGKPVPESEPDGTPEWQHKELDRHHVAAAYLAEADAVVTKDVHDLLSKAAAIEEACGVAVINPAEALSWLAR